MTDLWPSYGSPWPWYGYRNLGPSLVPPPPPNLGMIDRVTGQTWYLYFSPSRNHLVLYDTLVTGTGMVARVFAPYDGPFVEACGFRLGVNSGRLVIDPLIGNSGPGPFVRYDDGSLANLAQIVGVASPDPNVYSHIAVSIVPYAGS